MANVIVKEVGPNKVRVIDTYRTVAGLGLKQAKEAVDSVEAGHEIVISLEGAEQALVDEVIRQFIAVGAYAYEDKYKVNGSSFARAMEQSAGDTKCDTGNDKKSDYNVNNENELLSKKTVNFGTLDRDTTMQKLIEAGRVAKELEELSVSKGNIILQINRQKQEVEKIREYVPINQNLWTGPVIMMVLVSMFSMLLLAPVGIIVGLIWHHGSAKKYKEKYLIEHREENNFNAEKYNNENVVPLENRLTDTENRIADLYASGKVDEAVDFVGEDLFVYGCIEDLYNIIKSRKADNLKEALNIYDDALHKARMEEMQAAIQNASEIAAVEAVKQTTYSKEIAKSSHQAATAAKATAYHTRQIDKSTRQFRK